MPSRLIRRKDQAILQHSEITKKFPWLLEFMQLHPHAKETILDELPTDRQVWFRDVYPKVVQSARNEWKLRSAHPCDIKEDGDEIPCGLCGTKIKYIFYIVNRENGNELNVGRECAKEWEEIKINIKDLERHARRVKNLEAVATKFHGISDIVKNWSFFLDEQDILVSLELEAPFLKLGEQAAALYEQSLSNGMTDDCEQALREVLAEREMLVTKVEEYVKQMKDKPLAPNRAMVGWLRQQPNGMLATQQLKEDGLIKWRTAHRIAHKPFAESLIPQFNRILFQCGWQIESFGEHGARPVYVLCHKQSGSIRFFRRYSDFVLEYGGPVFEEARDSVTFEGVLDSVFLYQAESVAQALEIIADKLANSGIRLRGYDLEFDEAIFHDANAGGFRVSSQLTQFANDHRTLLFSERPQVLSKAKEYLQTLRLVSRDSLSERQQVMLSNR